MLFEAADNLRERRIEALDFFFASDFPAALFRPPKAPLVQATRELLWKNLPTKYSTIPPAVTLYKRTRWDVFRFLMEV